MINANFCLKLKEKGYSDDPPLGDGWSHFVLHGPFMDYVREWGWQVEVSTTLFPSAVSFAYTMPSLTCVTQISLRPITGQLKRRPSLQ